MKRKIDHIDKSILRVLQESADRPYKQMSSILHSPTSTISERIKKLKQSGIIISTVVKLDRKKLQQDILGHVYLRLTITSKEVIEKFRQKLLLIREVSSCTSITGSYNIKIKVITNDTSRFHEIEREIASFPHVERVLNYIELDEIIPYSGFHF
ncbi:Lrp/AsnC family transcriptional regulator [Pedobacter antarcticus]|uniref:HTH asnC-type domain-containing protein n=2 Tax=Pedobacter antarcticus TaxID=34086 RepID=A0A081PLX9_9SPHI|nr:Lrp/AsnC family transcriptional regulator [Pedobacter antarcticus]KEQ31702.1 hypothetical protein N180_14485 [Pedobacter antarcticus 4BY]SDL50585.1 Lrp/AsnC family transcriptional regulator, regulator for asnA, asnC and gidA [Pedobacter antarcticus]SFE34724.1 Lrp/AsnC family transcriptional regulator, regulator for asnA, asnC and gidA [Pedobacter antarcticus]